MPFRKEKYRHLEIEWVKQMNIADLAMPYNIIKTN